MEEVAALSSLERVSSARATMSVEETRQHSKRQLLIEGRGELLQPTAGD